MPSSFTDLVTYGAVPVLVAVGVVAAGICTLRGQWRTGMGLGLDFWLAAGLLTLAVATTWTTIATVAVIVAVRIVATWSLDHPLGDGHPRGTVT